MGKSKTTQFDAEERDFLRARVMELEKTVDELREINQDLAKESSDFRKEIERYRTTIEAIEARINRRRADIQEMNKRLYNAIHTTRASLRFCEDMEKSIDEEEHYADIVY